MKKLFSIKQFCSSKKSLHFFDKKILSFPAIKRGFLPVKSSPKFGVSYSVFDGEELLEASINSIRKQVDYINVVYQLVSWHGNPADESLLKNLQPLKEKGLIDEIIFFEPDLKKSPQVNETNKRNIGLQAAVKNGVNYFMTMDCDEFYFDEELEKAKKEIINRKITHSYCSQIAYGKDPTQQLLWNDLCNLQFFSKVDRLSILACNEFAPCRVDPTRKILDRKASKHFMLDMVRMHHMRLVRKDMKKKYLNTSFRNCGEKPPEIEMVKNDILVKVKDHFNLTKITQRND